MQAPRYVVLSALLLLSLRSAIQNTRGQTPTSGAPAIPTTWDAAALTMLEVPLAEPTSSAIPVSPDFYYAMPVRVIYKGYPVYAAGHEPPGYLNWLKQQEPDIVWGEDAKGQLHTPQLNTDADWIKAGQSVFDAPIFYDHVTTHSQNQARHRLLQGAVTKRRVVPRHVRA